MTRIYTCIFGGLIALLFSACAATALKQSDEKVPEDSGSLIISTTFGTDAEGEKGSIPMYGYKLLFRKVGTIISLGDAITIQLGSTNGFGGGIDTSFTDVSGFRGELFAFSLAPDEYELYKVIVYTAGGKRISDRDLSFEFSLEEGQLLYLGDVLTAFQLRTNFVGFQTIHKARVEVRDSSKRDLALFKERYKKLDHIPVQKSLLSGKTQVFKLMEEKEKEEIKEKAD